MEPVKKTIIIHKEIWSCNYPKHRHLSYDVAKKCMERRPINSTVPTSLNRNINISIDILNGESYKNVGNKYGISAGRASQIFCDLWLKCKFSNPSVVEDAFAAGLKDYHISHFREIKDFIIKELRKYQAYKEIDCE